MTYSEKNLHDIPVEDLYSFINDFPALLWRIEIVKSRIEFLNNNTAVAPGVDGALLLKNIDYRDTVLLPEGHHLIDIFMDSVKEGKKAATVFRVKAPNGGFFWLKLTGALNQRDPRYYYGYLLNVDDTVSVIKGILGIDLELMLMIEDEASPVFLIEYESLELVCANPPAKQLFGFTDSDFRKMSFDKFYCGEMKTSLKSIIKDLPLSRKWKGKCEFQSTDQTRNIHANTVVRYLVHKQSRLVRVSLQNPKVSPAAKVATSISNAMDMDILRKKIEGLSDINDILETCLSSPMASEQYEAILFSDVYVRTNKVLVHGSGQPFSGMSQAETFFYKGTIAEDINRYSLDYLVVDDTQDSIKPIDWALFVPRGIRSYFAMPFYSRGVLRTVLILCSTAVGHFAGRIPEDYTAMFNTINNAVRAWRRHHRG